MPFDLNQRPEPEPRPARWRNYYRLYRVLNLVPLGPLFPGLIASPFAFPTQDAAEAHARAMLAYLNRNGRTLLDHAGAFPEGEKAN